MPLFRNIARLLGLLTIAALLPLSGRADQGYPYDGVRVIESQKKFKTLFNDLDAAVRKHRMGVVSRASASMGAARQGVENPGNAVYGVFRNDYAVRMLRASVPAGIEAPLRFYVTQNVNGTARLSYRRPSAVFKPYGSADLDAMAGELDVIFARIAKDAVTD
ncbi:MAG: DUF302 domain-containing protein [Rhodospirillaceae bacterium]|jgi:uncharacterized protein (DUF302 family)|nr:DUF302 domain-containing protein [Rhodospirillaceae bacterium]MBT3492463.1 DUF302 domain-containing protein [Rhodospirillaceae bacterium]MBT3782941.1 DUF302 domain-containing protein [Rhodospirillaceae bacterium]MBT3977830.1 DUF302 domain-containing protein [Rhodospirillaceae bacterium]MBT4171451.1 DUF302 domain-containing protein [Rhodospirillaceae bacterium]